MFFSSKDGTKEILIEVISYSDAAILRTAILASSPILEPFLKLFEPMSFIVLGLIRDNHREILERGGKL